MAERRERFLKILNAVVEEPRLYDIACALRGPDFPAPNLKELFTARIRALLGSWCAGVMRWKAKVDFEAVRIAYREAYLAAEKGADATHYLDHVLFALESIDRLGVVAGEKLQEVIELERLASTFKRLLSERKSLDEADAELERLYNSFEVIKVDEGASDEKAE